MASRRRDSTRQATRQPRRTRKPWPRSSNSSARTAMPTRRLGREFAALWLSESKPYALDWTLRRYTNAVNEYDALLRTCGCRRRRGARRAAACLPPEEIGLALPQARCPAGSRPAGIRRDATGAGVALGRPDRDASARADRSSGRGRSFSSAGRGRARRCLRPWRRKPVRAFLMSGPHEPPRELLAQLDPLDQPGKSRLVLILDGPLRQERRSLCARLSGIDPAARPFARRGQHSRGADGRHWIENDQIRAAARAAKAPTCIDGK